MNKRQRKKMYKKITNMNIKISNSIDIFQYVKEEDILQTDINGVIQIDWNNPRHVNIYKLWMED